MMARWFCTALVSSVFFGSGCCCLPCGTCGPCDPCTPKGCLAPRCCLFPCLPCCPKPITWDGCCNECGPSPHESCAGHCAYNDDCGLLSHWGPFLGLRSCMSCNRGCGEIYSDEWYSDPPDCCDPCDRCYGEFTGQSGYCCLGPFQRMLACLHGYKYCPPPNCGPWRPIFGHCAPCGGCGPACGEPGCTTCGGGPVHGADIYYDGPAAPRGVPTQPRTTTAPATRGSQAPAVESTSVIEEPSEMRTPPQSGRTIQHNSAPQPWNQLGGRMPQKMSPAQVAAWKAAQKKKAAIGAGVRQANYQP